MDTKGKVNYTTILSSVGTEKRNYYAECVVATAIMHLAIMNLYNGGVPMTTFRVYTAWSLGRKIDCTEESLQHWTLSACAHPVLCV